MAKATVTKKPVSRTNKSSAAKNVVTKNEVVSRSVKVDRPRENRNIILARFNTNLEPRALVSETFGTFVLVSVAMFSGEPIYMGLTLAALAFGIMAISGSHLNPAVSFGLWTMRKLPSLTMLFYWVAQFLGALLAILVSIQFSGQGFGFSLDSFTAFESKIFLAEMVGMAVFMFGITSAVNRGQTDGAKAAGVGLSFFLGLLIATSFLSVAAKSVTTESGTDQPRLSKVNNVTLNPATALALKEVDTQAVQQDPAAEQPATQPNLPSRLTLETIFGTLLGAAIGGNLYAILASRNRDTL